MKKATIVCGAPGAGKSTYARRLAKDTGAALIDIDVATEHLVQTGLTLAGKDPGDRDSSFFKDNFRQPIYEQMFDIAFDNLSFIDVVLVGPFTREIRNPEWPGELMSRLGAKVEVHYIRCSPKVRKRRIESRGNPRDHAKLQDWDEYIGYYGTEDLPCFPHVVIENDNDIEV
jgi:predicted kinase